MSADQQARGDSGTARFLHIYNMALLSIAATAMGLIVAVMGAQVFFRYALNDSLIWAEEICRYLLMLMTFLLIGPAYQRGEMVSVQFFMYTLPRWARKIVAIPVHLAMIGFLLTISYFAYQFATFNGGFAMPAVDFILSSLTGRQVSNAISMYWIYLLIPLGCLLLAAHMFLTLLQIARAAPVAGDEV
jgi:TRAP-type C4-dicarboxylate transport system permease small subunit